MFPIEFPLKILRQRARRGDLVLDPFCGRGTTNFAARLLGLHSFGVDSSPVAIAITASKLVTATADEILAEARKILAGREPHQIPVGKFWRLAYHPTVLDTLCKFREALQANCSTAPRVALRGIILGALHGPKQRTFPSYFSNQCPRTYAPKPAYATSFWRDRGLMPEQVDVLAIIQRRANRYYQNLPGARGLARLADSRRAEALHPETDRSRFNWVITSPPYYGMRTYLPDQWLRNWFLGGPASVDYAIRDQLVHSSPDAFSADLRQVWCNVGAVCTAEASLVVRFGGIADRRADPLDLIKSSLRESGWRVATIHKAGAAREGRRQADAFLRTKNMPMAEYDLWAIKH